MTSRRNFDIFIKIYSLRIKIFITFATFDHLSYPKKLLQIYKKIIYSLRSKKNATLVS
jgi:hypothetical protein